MTPEEKVREFFEIYDLLSEWDKKDATKRKRERRERSFSFKIIKFLKHCLKTIDNRSLKIHAFGLHKRGGG